MKRPIATVVPACLVIVSVSSAFAGSSSVGLRLISERDPYDVAIPTTAKIEVEASHLFDNGVMLGTSFEHADTAFSSSNSQNLEGTVGYRLRFNDAFGVTGSAGIGEHFSSSSPDFPYYVFRLAADLKITEIVTWDTVYFRYRDSFDPDDDYLTPQIATGVTFKLDEHNSVSGRVAYNWTDWDPDSIAFSVGYKYGF